MYHMKFSLFIIHIPRYLCALQFSMWVDGLSYFYLISYPIHLEFETHQHICDFITIYIEFSDKSEFQLLYFYLETYFYNGLFGKLFVYHMAALDNW